MNMYKLCEHVRNNVQLCVNAHVHLHEHERHKHENEYELHEIMKYMNMSYMNIIPT